MTIIKHKAFYNILNKDKEFFNELLENKNGDIINITSFLNRIKSISEQKHNNLKDIYPDKIKLSKYYYGPKKEELINYFRGLSVSTISDLINFLKTNNSVALPINGETVYLGKEYIDIDLGKDKLKGHLFEIFFDIFFNIEGIINKKINGQQITIESYYPISDIDDHGIDAMAIRPTLKDGKRQDIKVAIQIKYRDNEDSFLIPDDLKNFEGKARRDNAGIFILCSSNQGLSEQNNKNHYDDCITNLNITQLKNIIGKNNIPFWNKFKEIINDSIDSAKYNIVYNNINTQEFLNREFDKLSSFKRYNVSKGDYDLGQKECLQKMDENKTCNINIPTGTGKNRLGNVKILKEIISGNKEVFAYAAPSILLCKQILSDIFEMFCDFGNHDNKCDDLIGEIGYILVSSEDFDTSMYYPNNDKTDPSKIEDVKRLNQILKNKGISVDSIIKTCSLSSGLLKQTVNSFKKVVVVSTYHSLHALKNIDKDIDILICDEAHRLATEKQVENPENSENEPFFKKNFFEIKDRCENKYFLSATPKDWQDEEDKYEEEWQNKNGFIDGFLMSNEKFFGPRFGMTARTAIDLGYIVSPIIDIVKIEIDEDRMNDSETNDLSYNAGEKAKAIFKIHEIVNAFLTKNSAKTDAIASKLIVKCKNVSEDMWFIHKELLELKKNNPEYKDIDIFAGASIKDTTKAEGEKKYERYINGEGCDKNGSPIKQEDYLMRLRSIPDNKKAIILHYNTLTEGVDSGGLNSLLFLNSIANTEAAIIQSIGRILRLMREDREKLLALSGEEKETFIKSKFTKDSKWIKGLAPVIIPYWNKEGKDTSKIIEGVIWKLLDLGFELSGITIGDDAARTSGDDDDDDNFNEPDGETKIKRIKHNIKRKLLIQKMRNTENMCDRFDLLTNIV